MLIGYRTILVTGAGGFVGRYLIQRLAAVAGPETRLIAADRSGHSTDLADHVVLDLSHPASVAAAIEATRPDLVFHLAGQASVAGASSAETETWRTNVVGSLELALALKTHAPKAALIFASSAEVYGKSFIEGIVEENTVPLPTSIYARSKLVAEVALAEALSPEASLVVVRPSNHVGPGQDERFALPSFAGQIARAEAAAEAAEIYVGNLAAERDFMDVRDVVNAYIALAQTLSQLGSRTTVNLSSGTTRSLQSLLDGLRAIASVATVVKIDPERFRASEIPTAAVRSDRIRELTGWSPKRLFDTTLADILADARCKGST